MCREFNRSIFDFGLELLEGGGMEGSFPIEQFIDDDAEWPNINFVVVSLVGQDLRRNIEGCSFDGVHECSRSW